MYKVIKSFVDLKDDNYKYEVGDEYPRLGLQPSIARIAELSSTENRRKTKLIEEVKEETPAADEAAEEAEVKKKPASKKTKK